MSYAERTRRPPRTPTERELKKILKVTGEAKSGFRDHMIISLALGCGLRESEIVALDVGDVATEKDIHKPRRIVQLRVFKRAGKGAGAEPDFQRVHLPDATYYKLTKYLKQFDESDRRGPLFWSKKGNRLSTRRLRAMWRNWQIAADFDQLYPFHSLRHAAITNVKRATGDIRIAQRFARHVNIQTTIIYDHPGDDELSIATKDLLA
ncbi:MAG TPA: tyrosine-type recombinase/integrase [Solirubrobacterales bacterium]|nr:tyrosine-type recombinase/integrase [Solirubrobacterales bacterium]